MITAVDTSVLLDIFGADPKFGRASVEAFRRSLTEGVVVASPVVWSETAAAFPDEAKFTQAMETLGVEFSAIEQDAAQRAGAAWRSYRRSGGQRDRVAADFLIGAHAQTQCEQLLTRDRGFYRRYFSGLKIIDPAA